MGDMSVQRITVLPEPILLRVVTKTTLLQLGAQSQKVLEVSAFDADLRQISMAVDIAADDISVFRE
ncbi:MAG: hypothetical protein IIB77_09070 [Proteobacteria bacterium]|nr:hypothetical protein [Pseudomonadota bacterium]